MVEEEEIKKEPLLELLEGGIVVDPDLASKTPCVCVKIDDKELCWSPGIIGALSYSQRGPLGQPGPYCPTKKYETSPRIEERIKRFREAVKECEGVTGPGRWKCLSEAFKKHGIET